MNMQADSEIDSEERSPTNPVTPGELLAFVRGAARRHARLGIIVGVSVAAVGLVAARFVPVKYETTSRIFVDETAAKTEALSTPNRALPNLDPISGTYELLMQKSTRVALVEETGLLENWEANRPAPMRLKDKLVAWIAGSPTVAEKREALADMLSNNIFVMKDKNLVKIRVIWTDRVLAYKLAKLAQSKFIEFVRARETGAFSSAITILEEETKRAGEEIAPALTEAIKAREAAAARANQEPAPAPASTPPPQAVVRRASVAAAPTPAAAEPAQDNSAQILSTKLAELSARIKAVEEPWRRRQVELNSRLNELRVVYGEEHPSIIQQKEQIKAAGVPPTELQELNNSRAELLEAIKRAPTANPSQDTAEARVVMHAVGATRPRTPPRAVLDENGKPRDLDEDPVVVAAKAGLSRAISKYSQLTERLESARLQFITAQAAFNSRLVVTGNPEVPRKPMKPLNLIVSIAAVFAAILLGVLVGALRDLASGKIHELWQVKPLGLKPLGEVWIAKHSD